MKKSQKKIKRPSSQFLSFKQKIKRRWFRSLRLKKRIERDELRRPDLRKAFTKCPEILINEITNFLDLESIVSLFKTNQHFYKNINAQEGLRQKIEIAKIELGDEIYSMLNDVACKQTKELLNSDEIKKTMNSLDNTGENLIIHELKKSCCIGNLDTYVAITIAQRMFFDIWSNIWNMNPNLYAGGKFSIKLLENFLNTDGIKQQNKSFLQEKYIRCTGNVFIDCLKMYVDKITVGFDKRSKTKVMSEFIRFWLWQLTNLGKKKEQENNQGSHIFACCLLVDMWEVTNMDSFFFGSTNCDFSITFKNFVENLSAKRLESFFLDDKYNFWAHFRGETWNNLDVVIQRIIKSQNLMKEKVESNIEILLENLALKCSRFIKKLRVVLPDKTKNLQNRIKFFVGDGKNSNCLSLEELKLKLKSECPYYERYDQDKLHTKNQNNSLFKNPFIK